MNTRIVGAVAILVLLVLAVACSASAGSQAPTDLQKEGSGAVSQTEAWWTEQEAIAVVKHEVRESVVSCGRHEHTLDSYGIGSPNNCQFNSFAGGSPVLDAFGRHSSLSIRTTMRLMFEEGIWSASYKPESRRWLVIAIMQSGSIGFYVNERTGLVEGIPPG